MKSRRFVRKRRRRRARALADLRNAVRSRLADHKHRQLVHAAANLLRAAADTSS